MYLNVMYRNHDDKQLNMFSSLEQIAFGRTQKKLSDEDAWYNIFRKYYFDQIDEEPYKVLYSMNLGRPNQSVKVLLGMMLQGYHTNIMETCDQDEKTNLITDVITTGANIVRWSEKAEKYKIKYSGETNTLFNIISSYSIHTRTRNRKSDHERRLGNKS